MKSKPPSTGSAVIETRLARRHLKDGTLVLYDVTSTYLEGRRPEAACAQERHRELESIREQLAK